MSVLGVLLEGFDDAKHPRGPLGRWIATFHHSVHGRITQPVDAHSSSEAFEKAKALKIGTVQSVAPHDSAAVQILQRESGRKYGSVGQAARAGALPSQRPEGQGQVRPTGQKFDSIGAAARAGQLPSQQRRSAPSVTHATLTRQLENLPEGRYHSLPGLADGGAIARKTAAGIEVYRALKAQPEKVHKTPTAAASHMIRIRRAGLQEAQPLVLGALLDRDFSAERRRKLASSGAAMKDGSFPIENASDLSNAVQAVGRASSPDAAKAHIRKRARALGLTSRLPDGW